MADLEQQLQAASGARRKLIATDGVFSMDGYVAPLKEICDLAERYNAMVMVDDSHAVGFIGPERPWHTRTAWRAWIAWTSSPARWARRWAAPAAATPAADARSSICCASARALISSRTRWLRPSSAASLKALELLTQSDDLRARLRSNTKLFRERMSALGFDILPGDHPIAPVMLGDAHRATQLADRLLQKGVYVIAFSYPVVPQGKARIRTQVSAAHSESDLLNAAAAFAAARDELGL